MTDLSKLFPRPRKLKLLGGGWSLPEGGGVVFEGPPELTAPARARLMRCLGPNWREGIHPTIINYQLSIVNCQFTPNSSLLTPNSSLLTPNSYLLTPNSYRLTITGGGVAATAPDRGGLFYAAVTFAQIVRLAGGGPLPCCEIEDAPDFPLRGVMLDVSRDKVPTLDTLLWLVDRLADLKFNHLQLYVEHTFAYRNHREVWQHASPLTADDIRALDAHCAARCIELVPNQNSFGHMERWFAHPRYLPLAELPQGGAPLPWGGVQETPSALCPTAPRTFGLLAELYDEYLPNFSSRLFNVGCDETFDLRGGGRSRQHIERLGEGRVYLDYLLRLHGILAERGFRMAFWGDIIISHPGLVPEIPKDALVLEWGYEADHPFDAHGAKFAAAGVPFCVCPGTSSWNSLGGRTDNMIANLTSAAENGLKHGACGYIVCDWGDGGHWHPLALSFPGLTVAAGLSWCLDANRGTPWADAADAHLTEGLGKTLFALGEVYRLCGATRGNGTELFQILSKPFTRPVAEGVTWEKLRDVYHRTCELEKSLPDPLHTITWWRRLLCAIRGKPLFERESILQQELRHAIHLTQAAAMKGWGMLDKTASTEKTQAQLQRLMNHLIEDHRRVWLLRNREGGLSDSIKRFERIRDELAR